MQRRVAGRVLRVNELQHWRTDCVVSAPQNCFRRPPRIVLSSGVKQRVAGGVTDAWINGTI
jgi:hypothetical protein